MGSGWELALEEWPEKILSAGSWDHQDHIKEGGEKAGREETANIFLVLPFCLRPKHVNILKL